MAEHGTNAKTDKSGERDLVGMVDVSQGYESVRAMFLAVYQVKGEIPSDDHIRQALVRNNGKVATLSEAEIDQMVAEFAAMRG